MCRFWQPKKRHFRLVFFLWAQFTTKKNTMYYQNIHIDRWVVPFEPRDALLQFARSESVTDWTTQDIFTVFIFSLKIIHWHYSILEVQLYKSRRRSASIPVWICLYKRGKLCRTLYTWLLFWMRKNRKLLILWTSIIT